MDKYLIKNKRERSTEDKESEDKVETKRIKTSSSEDKLQKDREKTVNKSSDVTTVDRLEESLDESWREYLKDEFTKPYFKDLKKFLKEEYIKHGESNIFPPKEEIFNAFNHCKFDDVKVVILGQDPYQTPGFAHGLAFSVKPGVTIPKSLRNIYKELEKDIDGFKAPKYGTLTKWADQGVLLLNTVLTVRKGEANSHQKKGWEQFTDAVIDLLNKKKKGLVFFLWGKPAQTKGSKIDRKKHYVLESAHPSPLSASKGFFGCRHFSKCNEYLEDHKMPPIDWQV
jgi:uracil-DNA glycosylase